MRLAHDKGGSRYLKRRKKIELSDLTATNGWQAACMVDSKTAVTLDLLTDGK